MKYQVIKTITHEQGWSCAFRQWKADSHCRYLHGYALSATMVFEADDLDARNWVIDFGGFKDLKQALEARFDHKTVIAEDDPALDLFRELSSAGACELTVLPAVGCEAFAYYIYERTLIWLANNSIMRPEIKRVRLVSVEVREHGSNGARYGNN